MLSDLERLEEIESVIEELSATDSLILVEGMRDVEALESIGVRGNYVEVQSRGGPIKAAEAVYKAGGNAVIMTDWDRTGGRIAEELKNQLSALDVKWDAKLRARLSRVCKKDIKDIESLPSLLMRLRETVRP